MLLKQRLHSLRMEYSTWVFPAWTAKSAMHSLRVATRTNAYRKIQSTNTDKYRIATIPVYVCVCVCVCVCFCVQFLSLPRSNAFHFHLAKLLFSFVFLFFFRFYLFHLPSKLSSKLFVVVRYCRSREDK